MSTLHWGQYLQTHTETDVETHRQTQRHRLIDSSHTRPHWCPPYTEDNTYTQTDRHRNTQTDTEIQRATDSHTDWVEVFISQLTQHKISNVRHVLPNQSLTVLLKTCRYTLRMFTGHEYGAWTWVVCTEHESNATKGDIHQFNRPNGNKIGHVWLPCSRLCPGAYMEHTQRTVQLTMHKEGNKRVRTIYTWWEWWIRGNWCENQSCAGLTVDSSSGFQAVVTLTLTLYRVTQHTVVHQSLTSIYTPNVTEIGKQLFVYRRTYWRTFQTPSNVVRSTCRSRPKSDLR